MQDVLISVGHYSLFLALLTSGWATIAALLGAATDGPRLQQSAERAIAASAALTLLSAACLVHGFLTDDFRLDYVYFYSSSSQALQ